MNLTIQSAGQVSGRLAVPGNKSISHRAAIIGALADGVTCVRGFLRADDTLATIECLRRMGVTIELPADPDATTKVFGVGLQGLKAPEKELDCGNSGTTMRLLMGVLAGRPWPATFIGDASLNKRPMDRVQQPLGQMGARVSGQGNRCLPPITMCGGGLHGIVYRLPVASAQVKSAILLAGLQAEGETTVIEPSLTRDHTERMLLACGARLRRQEDRITVTAGAGLTASDIEVAGDISSAAYFLVAAALRPGWQVTVEGIGVNPTRTGIFDVLQAMGARVGLAEERVSAGEPIADVCVQGGPLMATEIAGPIIPRLIDELPVLAVLATQAEGRTVIRDAAEMRVKESDRIAIMTRELRKLGAVIEEKPDGMVIDGPTPLYGAHLTSPRGDHRIAMSLAVAGLVARGETVIENAEAITSSFPNFRHALHAITE